MRRPILVFNTKGVGMGVEALSKMRPVSERGLRRKKRRSRLEARELAEASIRQFAGDVRGGTFQGIFESSVVLNPDKEYINIGGNIMY